MAIDCGGGGFGMEVRGESNYQGAIAECVRGSVVEHSSELACHCEFDARLVREPQNPYDQNAIAVTSVAGETLGYVPREIARDLAPMIDRNVAALAIQCPARAYGRRARLDGSWNFGIWLDLPDPADLMQVLGGLDHDTIAEMGQPGASERPFAVAPG